MDLGRAKINPRFSELQLGLSKPEIGLAKARAEQGRAGLGLSKT